MTETNKIAVCVPEGGKVSGILSSMGYECVGFKPDSLSLITAVITYSPCAVIVDSRRISPAETSKALAAIGSRHCPVCIALGEDNVNAFEGVDNIYRSAQLPEPGVLRLIISGHIHDSFPGEAEENMTAKPCPNPQKERMEDGITKIIRKIGIPANIKGYRYIRTAIMLVIDDPSLMESVTKELYPEIALRHESTPARVERAIRHAITVAWDRAEGDEEYLSERLHCRIDFSGARPTNSELIALISDSLMLEARGKKAELLSLNV